MPIKIAFINHSSSLYGANRSLVNLIEGLKDYDVEAFVILKTDGDLVPLLEKAGATVSIVPFKLWVSHRSRKKSFLCKFLGERWFVENEWRDQENISRIVKLLKEWNVDLVQSNSAVIPAGYYASRKLSIPHIWHLREFLEYYGFHFNLGDHRAKQIINSSEACIAISESIAEHYFIPKSLSMKKVIYNGVLSRSNFNMLRINNEEYKKGHDAYTFGLIGHIQPAKGFDVAIRALSLVVPEFPHVKLSIAGGGAVSDLKELAADLKVTKNIDWLGIVDDPYRFYSNIDALLMCSRKEGMGRVTVESFAACKPVIGFDNAGTSELIMHGKIGMLYQGGHAELASAMRIYLNDPDSARIMGMAAWDYAQSRFTNEVCARQFHQIARDLLKT